MPIQIIITGNDPAEVRGHMHGFLTMPIGPKVEQIDTAASAEPERVSNGAADPQAAEQMTPKPRKGRPKKTTEEAPAQEAAGDDDETQTEVADEAQAEDMEAARDRVRAVLNEHYVDKYGMDFTIPDILWMYKERFPDGSGTKVSDIPEGMHDPVIQDIIEMSKVNYHKRKRIDL